jgi:hypothetical protein
MRVVDTRVEAAGPGRFVIVTTVELGNRELAVDIGIDQPILGDGPSSERGAIPDLIVQALIERAPEPITLRELQDLFDAEVDGANRGTINRQAWTLATNAPDLQRRLRGWVVSVGHGRYALSDAALEHLAAHERVHTAPGDDSRAMQELADGVAFWRTRRSWPSDFHNADYARWSEENPHGEFTMAWWGPFLKTLQAWIATRPISGRVLTERFIAAIPALAGAWQSSCEPFLDRDIASISWEEVQAFPDVVATIKPTLAPSPVFTSKFCHFLLPRVFPVVDNEALGGSWPSYETYFRFVQDEWSATQEATRAELEAALKTLIESAGRPAFPGFPMVNKIVELRLMGRRHPGRR